VLSDRPAVHGPVQPASAAVKNHHAFHGGLLQHVVKLMELAWSVSKHYPQLDGERC
jgi:3'-5' exoribonuclease